MHRYDIYLLKSEFAHSFMRAEEKLFRLFKEYETVKPLRSIVKKQIAYVCRPLSIEQIFHSFPNGKLSQQKINDQPMIFFEVDQQLKMSVSHERVQIWSEEGMDNEWPWFDVLQSIDPYFFACDIEREKYGWLKPIKMKSLLFENV